MAKDEGPLSGLQNFLNLKNCLQVAKTHAQDNPVNVIEMMSECIPHLNQTKKVVVVGYDDLQWAIEKLKGRYE